MPPRMTIHFFPGNSKSPTRPAYLYSSCCTTCVERGTPPHGPFLAVADCGICVTLSTCSKQNHQMGPTPEKKRRTERDKNIKQEQGLRAGRHLLTLPIASAPSPTSSPFPSPIGHRAWTTILALVPAPHTALELPYLSPALLDHRRIHSGRQKLTPGRPPGRPTPSRFLGAAGTRNTRPLPRRCLHSRFAHCHCCPPAWRTSGPSAPPSIPQVQASPLWSGSRRPWDPSRGACPVPFVSVLSTPNPSPPLCLPPSQARCPPGLISRWKIIPDCLPTFSSAPSSRPRPLWHWRRPCKMTRDHRKSRLETPTQPAKGLGGLEKAPPERTACRCRHRLPLRCCCSSPWRDVVLARLPWKGHRSPPPPYRPRTLSRRASMHPPGCRPLLVYRKFCYRRGSCCPRPLVERFAAQPVIAPLTLPAVKDRLPAPSAGHAPTRPRPWMLQSRSP